MKSLSLKVPEQLDNRLSAACRRRREKKSEVIRAAIEQFLISEESVIEGSCLDLARDLAGCIEGPGDLSFNKKHMRGYGK